ncbi:hypothetical protein AURDEDRAFT_173074 [Auricularia subglabra TFB-10046 SS5]|uniref:F-box domain-containing protein n=1 Tax=Auricularia subglabra (strain TFB-10046 / SS5) TaxID=717982 RepID=J0DBG5_AURST|nr:hypothetical protein AURDEDRAFT_173074 [Auricularia subglabra TFB-10046 SS5]
MPGAPHQAFPLEASDSRPHCFVHLVPSELLGEIFSYLDLFVDLVSSTMVCRAWRGASLAAPALLWSYVSCAGRKPGVFTQMLARTADVPICVTVTIRTTNASEVAAAFQLHMHHIQHLSIRFGHELALHAKRSLDAALSIPAPMLETLVLFDNFFAVRSSLALCDVPPVPFAGGAPSLTYFMLNGDLYDYPARSALWPSLRQLLYAPAGRKLDMRVFDRYIAHFDALEILGIEFTEVTSGSPPDVDAIRLPASLEKLDLICSSRELELQHLLERMLPRSVRHLSIGFTTGCIERVATQLQAFMCGRYFPRDMAISSLYDSGNIDIQAASEIGLLWEIYEVSPALTNGVFFNLRMLSVSDLEWTRFDGQPTVPLLASLEVRLIAPCLIADYGHSSLCLHFADQCVLRCPELQTLSFSTVPRETEDYIMRPILAPEMITEFIRFKIELSSEPLAILLLSGVELLQSNVHSVATLLGAVDDIHFDPGCLAGLRSHPYPMSVGWDM